MPSTASDRLDGLSTSVAVKAPCVGVESSNITLSGLQGYTADDRVLLIGQTDQTDNGIYNPSTGSWTRAKDFDGNRDVVQGTRVLVVFPGSSPAAEYEVTSTNPITIGTSALTFTLRYGANATYDRTQAEIDAGVVPADSSIPSHDTLGYIDPDRYGFIYNDTDAAAGNDAALLQCLLVAEASGCKRIQFNAGTGWISDVFDLQLYQDYTICGVNQFVSVLRLTTGAANGTNVVRLGQFCSVENLWVRGNWGGATLGQLGVGIFAQNTTVGYIHGTNLWNVQVTHCKSHGIHEIDGAYHRGYNVLSDTHGADPIYIEGTSAGQSTTYEYTGKNVFSACVNGHVHVKNLFSSQFTFISEQTRGVLREGSCSLLNWEACHFEQVVTADSAGTPYTSNYIYNSNGGGCSNESIRNNYLGMLIATAAIEGDANYSGTLDNNRNLTAQVLVDAYQGNWWPKGVISARNVQFATVGNVDAGEDTIYTYTLPAGALAIDGDEVLVKVFGKTAANENNKTVKLYFGGTVIYNSTALAANDDDWILEATIIRSAASAQRTEVNGVFNNAVVGGTSSSANENTTAAIIIKVTGEGTATDDITGLGWSVKFSDYIP